MNLDAAVKLMRSSRNINEWNDNRDKVQKTIPSPQYTTKRVNIFSKPEKGKKPVVVDTVVKIIRAESLAIPIMGAIDNGLINEVLGKRKIRKVEVINN